MLHIPLCTTSGRSPLMLTCAALNTEAMAATNALPPAQPEPFLFSPFFSSLFFFFSFFIFLYPSEFQSALCPAIQRRKLRIGCGSDGRSAHAFFLMILWGECQPPTSLSTFIPQSLPLMAITITFQDGKC